MHGLSHRVKPPAGLLQGLFDGLHRPLAPRVCRLSKGLPAPGSPLGGAGRRGLRVAFLTLGFVLTLFLSWSPKSPLAQPPTHTVVEGDTLWGLCRDYYGDEGLWPRLWEMNPFVTNPHLLRPGDVLVLLEGAGPKAMPPEAPAEAEDVPVDDPGRGRGLDLSYLLDVEAVGFFSTSHPRAQGRIVADTSPRALLNKGDIVYITPEKGMHMQPGEQHCIFKGLPSSVWARKGEINGTLVAVLGKLLVTEAVMGPRDSGEPLFKAEILKSYRPIRVGDSLLSRPSLSSCVKPSLPDWNRVQRLGTSLIPIAGTPGQNALIGQRDVLYLAAGQDQGILRGNLLELTKANPEDVGGRRGLPLLRMGYALVLEAHSTSASAVVLSSVQEFSRETFARVVDIRRPLMEAFAIEDSELDPGELERDLLGLILRLYAGRSSDKALPGPIDALLRIPSCVLQ